MSKYILYRATCPCGGVIWQAWCLMGKPSDVLRCSKRAIVQADKGYAVTLHHNAVDVQSMAIKAGHAEGCAKKG